MFETVILVLDSTVRLATPLLLAALAGLFSERSGVFDIGLEGKMLGAAFAAGAAAGVTGSVWLGLLAGVGVSIGLALVHGFACITNRGNQIVSGGRTPPLGGGGRFRDITLPFAEELRDVPVIGGVYSELLSGHNILVYAAFVAVPLSWWILFRTRFGLRLRAVGENPAAVDTAGISVAWLRYRAVICTGILCGFAGAYLSIAQSAGFIKDMTAGKGFIALAALIFAKWKPLPVMFACLLFGFLDAAAIRLQGQQLPVIGEVPVQAIQALPYILTVVLLAGFIGKAVPPRAGGTAYVKERT
jgi:simple sugar transport system permease protein